MEKQEDDFSFKDYFVPLTNFKAISWITFIGLVVYLNSLFNGFIGDDYSQLVNNNVVHSITNFFLFFTGSTFSRAGSTALNGIYYKPLLSVVYSILFTFFGNTAFIYHILQLLLHIGNSILLFLIVKKLLKNEIAFGIALIFLIHPINNESVVYISALQETLFLFFGLVALKLVQQKGSSIYRSFTITLCLLFSLLSKETGILFLIMLPVYTLLFYRKWKLALLQSGIAITIYLLLRFFIGHVFINQNSANIPFNHTSLLEKFVNFPAIAFFYIKAFFFPYDLISNQRWIIHTLDFHSFYIPLILDICFFVVLVVFGWAIYLKKKSSIKLFAFFALWFLIGMGINLQIIPLDFTTSDRWFYFPIIGLLGMLGVVFHIFHLKDKRIILTSIIGSCLIIFIFGIRDIVRNSNWQDNLTLYQHDMKYGVNDYTFQLEYATELSNHGNQNEAKQHILSSISLRPGVLNWTILGLIYARQHKLEQAKNALRTALTYDNNYYFTNITLAKLLTAYGDPKSTIPFLKQVLSKYPNDSMTWVYLAIEEYKIGNRNEALQAVRKSSDIQLSPESKYVYFHIINNQPIDANFEF